MKQLAQLHGGNLLKLWIARTDKGVKHLWRKTEAEARSRLAQHRLVVRSLRAGTERDYPKL